MLEVYIAMDDSLLVRMLDCGADLDEEASAVPRLLTNAHRSNRWIFDATHRVPSRNTVTDRFSGAAIEYFRNAGMIHQSECLPFRLETWRRHFFSVHAPGLMTFTATRRGRTGSS